MSSDATEDYLKCIYVRQAEAGPPVSTSDLAESLGKTAPSVTSMVEKLADRGLVAREKYEGVELTDEGETVALEVLRHHRLLEAYLADRLDYDWSEVHDEADRLEHHISEAFERRVAAELDDPDVDPHGDPIPTASLEPVDTDDTEALSAQPVDSRVAVARVSDRDEEELTYLADAGVEPGTELTVVDVAPFGMVTVATGAGDEQSLPEPVAEAIRVRPVETADAGGPNGSDGPRGEA